MEQRNLVGTTVIGHKVVRRISQNSKWISYQGESQELHEKKMRSVIQMVFPTKEQQEELQEIMEHDITKVNCTIEDIVKQIYQELNRISHLFQAPQYSSYLKYQILHTNQAYQYEIVEIKELEEEKSEIIEDVPIIYKIITYVFETNMKKYIKDKVIKDKVIKPKKGHMRVVVMDVFLEQ